MFLVDLIRRWPVQVASALLVLSLTLGSLLVVVVQSGKEARERLDRNYMRSKANAEEFQKGFDALSNQLRAQGITPTTVIVAAPTTTGTVVAVTTTTRRTSTTAQRRPAPTTRPAAPTTRPTGTQPPQTTSPPTSPPCTAPIAPLC